MSAIKKTAGTVLRHKRIDFHNGSTIVLQESICRQAHAYVRIPTPNVREGEVELKCTVSGLAEGVDPMVELEDTLRRELRAISNVLHEITNCNWEHL